MNASTGSCIAERNRGGVHAAKEKGRQAGGPPLDQDELSAAMLLVKTPRREPKTPARPAGRSTVDREIQAGQRVEP